jgi:hypothetical protein
MSPGNFVWKTLPIDGFSPPPLNIIHFSADEQNSQTPKPAGKATDGKIPLPLLPRCGDRKVPPASAIASCPTNSNSAPIDGTAPGRQQRRQTGAVAAAMSAGISRRCLGTFPPLPSATAACQQASGEAGCWRWRANPRAGNGRRTMGRKTKGRPAAATWPGLTMCGLGRAGRFALFGLGWRRPSLPSAEYGRQQAERLRIGWPA